ncbi:hypothetical protein [Allosphingosinicella sp.]|uniref:hypothetical protein n=1 Tax=Allosphingosinicella sp. TaxID=2823234 RepID=UPI0037836919
MGFLIDLILDWLGVSAADHVARKTPPWGCAIIMLAFAAGLIVLLFWLGSR